MSDLQKPSTDPEIEFQAVIHHPPSRQACTDQDFQSRRAKTNFDAKTKFLPGSPPKKPGFISLLHFFFVVKLVRYINFLKHRSPTEDDLKALVYYQTCQPLENLFTQYYYELKIKYESKIKLLLILLYRIFKKGFYLQVFWDVFYVIARILEPYFLYLTLNSLRNPTEPLANAYTAAVGVFICFLIATYSFHQFNFNSAFAANGMKIGLLGMLFRKINKVSLLSLQKISFGNLLNLVSDDVNNLDNVHFTLFLVMLPLTYGGSIALLCFWWGPSGLVPIGYMMLINVFQFIMILLTLGPGKERSRLLDERIRIMHEILEGIRVIKMQTWESFIIDKITKIRKNEIKELNKVFYFFSIARAVSYSSQYVAAFFLLLTYNEVDGNITAAKIFPTLLLLGFLKQIAVIFGLLGFVGLSLIISLSSKINTIMNLPEVPLHVEPLPPLCPHNSIEFHNFSGYWTKKDSDQPEFMKPSSPKPPKNPPSPEVLISPTPVVSNINLEIKTGELAAVIGLTGSGKSSLLMSFTREMIKTEGELRYTGSLEYLPQEPIISAFSIRDNITLGKAYDDELFWNVVEACCLNDMIANLPKKELTEMAERGVNLSGAQKMQIALARALYSKADIYLLDDPFSHFDQRLGKLIFRKAIQEFLKEKTIVQVTHNLDFAKHANKIVVLKTGSIIAQGKYGELSQKEIEIKIANALQIRADYKKKDLDSFGQGRQYGEVYNPLLKKKDSEIIKKVTSDTPLGLVEDDNGLFTKNERLDDGKVTFKIYWAYFRTIFNWWNIIPFAILFAATEAAGWQFMIRVSNWLLGKHSDSEGYGLLAATAFGSMILYAIKYVLYYTCGLHGARKLHDKMFKGMLCNSVQFFATNRFGTILNRFATDISQLDRLILNAFLDILEGFFFFVIYLIALWVREPWILIPVVIAITVFIPTFFYFRKPINIARGLELTVRGPLYSFFSNILNGLTVARVRDQTEDIMTAFYKRADDYSRASVAYKTSLRLMIFILDYITQLTVIGIFCFYISQKGNPIVDGPFINILISLPAAMAFLLKSFMNFHALMASVARIINYSQNHKGFEMIKVGDDDLKQLGWPHGGVIDIKHASMRYGDNKPLFIQDLNAHIKSGERVLVFGQSSFGMTSMINMITKTLSIEPNPDSYANIDGVKIEDVGLTLLRGSMAIITQTHYLFTGTIRENMDPEKKYTDKEIWDALDVTGLKEYIEGLDMKLDTYYVKGCSLFSAGQKQLLSLARSILKKDTSIVIQDRSTNFVDGVTEYKVQKKLRERYANATTLMTTYRLCNVGAVDMVLCMKDGVQMEFDEPYRLLVNEIGDKEITNQSGYFAGLVMEMNPKVTKQVFKLAMITYYKKHNLILDEAELPGELEFLEGPFRNAEDLINGKGDRLGEDEEDF